MDQKSYADPDFIEGWNKSIIENGGTYLYIAGSASVPNRVKIGITSDPLKRLSEIDISRYSLPLPYDIHNLFFLEQAHHIEKCVQLYLWNEGLWFWGELFDCPADEAAAVIRVVLENYAIFRNPKKMEKTLEILKRVMVADRQQNECAFEVARNDIIYMKAEKRYARSAAKKAKLIADGFNDFYQIAKHREWYAFEK